LSPEAASFQESGQWTLGKEIFEKEVINFNKNWFKMTTISLDFYCCAY
jgi:hypothetical protein